VIFNGEITDLRCADLRSADLRSANLHGAYLSGVNLRSAYLHGADLRSADLSGANLSGADLGEVFGKVKNSKSVLQIGPIGSRYDYLLSFVTDKGIVIKTGCFTGFIDDFAKACIDTHGDSDYGKEYALAIEFIKSRSAIWLTLEK
jgi:hypothetical protein